MAAKQAPTMGSSMAKAAVISMISTMPVSGARTTPVKKAAMPTGESDGAEQQPVVAGGQQPRDHAQHEEQRLAERRDVGKRLDGEVGVGAQQGAGDGDRRRRGGKGCYRDTMLEALHQLLEH